MRNRSTCATREALLPIWYVLNLTVQAAALVLMAGGDALGERLWIGGGVGAVSLIFAMEYLGARAFGHALPDATGVYIREQAARVAHGYPLTRRGYYLAHALGCWVVFGVGAIVAAHALGSSLRAHVGALQRAGDVVLRWPAGARVLGAFALLDCWSYFRHRIEHAGGERNLLWRLVHRWHHTPDHIDLWTGMVVHPLEAMLVFLVPCTLFAALGLARWELLFLFTLFLLITVPQHMNSGWTAGPVGVVLQGPDAHVRHHSLAYPERNANFADCLTLWDRLFGTYVRPPRETFVGPFGLGDAP